MCKRPQQAKKGTTEKRAGNVLILLATLLNKNKSYMEQYVLTTEEKKFYEEMAKDLDKYYGAIKEVKRDHIKKLTNNRLLSRRVVNRVVEHYDELGDWQSEGIVELELTEDKVSGRPNQCARIKDCKDKIYYLFHRQIEDEIKGINHIFLWQNNGGYTGDSYAGWSLIPLTDGRYWKLSYSC